MYPPPHPMVYPLSLHDALPICQHAGNFGYAYLGFALKLLSTGTVPKTKSQDRRHFYIQIANFEPQDQQVKVSGIRNEQDRKSTRLNSSHVATSYDVFCF